ncbi:MAG: L-rhamnose mutarotase [Oscillospiraceae bacterium]|jgi:L-rhamnose mutarotase|nr:L-rhamnose mutarotase [Oscillospiraceae bacterium]
MARYGWTWKVKPERVDEYVKMHLNPWPEIMAAHSKAGFRGYSIFQSGNQFFYTFECEGDPERAFAEMAEDPDCVRWNNITITMLEIDAENGGIAGAVRFLPEVFHLD